MLEKELGKKFGDPKNPLLVSVRSGAAQSMPGMMNTILNLGLNDRRLRHNGKCYRQRAVCLRRLSPAHQHVRRCCVRVDHELFEHAFDKVKAKYKVQNDTDVPVEGMIQLCDEYKKVFQKHFGKAFPRIRSSSLNWRSKRYSRVGCNRGR